MSEPLPAEVQAAALCALRKALNEGHLITGNTQQVADSIARAAIAAELRRLAGRGTSSGPFREFEQQLLLARADYYLGNSGG